MDCSQGALASMHLLIQVSASGGLYPNGTDLTGSSYSAPLSSDLFLIVWLSWTGLGGQVVDDTFQTSIFR